MAEENYTNQVNREKTILTVDSLEHEDQLNTNEMLTSIKDELSLQDLLERARQCKSTGRSFRHLYDFGRTDGYRSVDDAQQKLCDLLAFWCSRDSELMMEAFKGSKLYAGDFRQACACINEAIRTCTAVYDPEPSEHLSDDILRCGKIWDADGTGRYTIENLEYFLTKNKISVRTNVISREVEISGSIGKYRLYDLKKSVGIIFNYMSCLPKCQEIQIKENLEYIGDENRYNPILDIIQDTVWDGTDRIQQLYDMLHITDDLEKLFILKWLQQCIAALLQDDENPFSLDLVLVFTGKQGVGKTRLLEHLAMLPRYFSEGTSIDPTNKDSVRQATSCWIAELGEIGSTMKRDIDILKAFISQPKDTYRTPYAKGPDTYIRRTAFCGSTNEDEYLIDETGNRRFLTVKIKEDVVLSMDEIEQLDAAQMWAQVYAMVTGSGLPPARVFRFTQEEKEKLNKLNENHMKPLKGEHEVADLITFLLKRRPNTQRYYEYQTVTEFKMTQTDGANGWLSKYSAQQIAKVLKKLGYEPRRMRLHGEPNPSKYYRLPACRSSNLLPEGDSGIIDLTASQRTQEQQ